MFQTFFDASMPQSKKKCSRFLTSCKEWAIKFLTSSKSSESKTDSNKEPTTSWSTPNSTISSTAKSKSQSALLSLNSSAVPTKSTISFTNWKGPSLDLSWKCAVSGDTVTEKLKFFPSSSKNKSPEKLEKLHKLKKNCKNQMKKNWYQMRTHSFVRNAVDTTITTTTLKSIWRKRILRTLSAPLAW